MRPLAFLFALLLALPALALQKNVASQKLPVFAYDKTTGVAKTGDANNITANIAKDGAGYGPTNDVNPTEIGGGWYCFDLTQDETNANMMVVAPVSATANILLDPVMIYTTTVPATLTSMAGATFDTATDSLEALRNRGDAAWITATGFSTLSAADVSGAVWNAATATYGAAGSYGLLIETNLDSTISSRAAGATALSNAIWTDAKAGYLTATVPSISQIWGEALPGAYGAGTAGKLLSTAGSAADPWATSVPGAYATGTAGYIFGTINTKLSAATLSTQSLVADDGTATIFRGDDYLEADGRALTFTISNYSGPSLSGGTATLALITKANYDRGLTTSALSVTLTVTGTTTLTCKADLTDTQTAALASNPNQAVTYIYQLRATTKGGSKITLGQGTLVVRPRIAE